MSYASSGDHRPRYLPADPRRHNRTDRRHTSDATSLEDVHWRARRRLWRERRVPCRARHRREPALDPRISRATSAGGIPGQRHTVATALPRGAASAGRPVADRCRRTGSPAVPLQRRARLAGLSFAAAPRRVRLCAHPQQSHLPAWPTRPARSRRGHQRADRLAAARCGHAARRSPAARPLAGHWRIPGRCGRLAAGSLGAGRGWISWSALAPRCPGRRNRGGAERLGLVRPDEPGVDVLYQLVIPRGCRSGPGRAGWADAVYGTKTLTPGPSPSRGEGRLARRCHEKSEPPAIGYRLSAIGYRLSAIGHRLSAIGYRPSAIGHRLSAIGYRL